MGVHPPDTQSDTQTNMRVPRYPTTSQSHRDGRIGGYYDESEQSNG